MLGRQRILSTASHSRCGQAFHAQTICLPRGHWLSSMARWQPRVFGRLQRNAPLHCYRQAARQQLHQKSKGIEGNFSRELTSILTVSMYRWTPLHSLEYRRGVPSGRTRAPMSSGRRMLCARYDRLAAMAVLCLRETVLPAWHKATGQSLDAGDVKDPIISDTEGGTCKYTV